MPIIASFFGIYVRMYHGDHSPPHVHVEYQGHEALVGLTSGTIVEGHLPIRAARLVSEWCLDNQVALLKNWERACALEPLERIPGADND
jgi:hypothetical protein